VNIGNIIVMIVLYTGARLVKANKSTNEIKNL